MAISQNLQPKEVEYLKYLKGKGFGAEDSYKRLDNARTKGLFGTTPAPVVAPTQPVPEEKGTGILDAMKQGIKPLLGVPGVVKDIASDIGQGARAFGADISKIQQGTVGQDTGIAPGIVARTAERIQGAGEDIKAAKTAQVMGEQGGLKTQTQATGIVAGTLSDTLGDAFMSAIKTLAPEDIENATKEGAIKIAETKGGEYLMNQLKQAEEGMKYLEQTDPEKARNYKAVIGGLKLAADVVGFATVQKVASKTDDVLKAGVDDVVPTIVPKAEAPIVPKQGDAIVQGIKIEPVGGFQGIKSRIEKGPQELKGVVGQEPIIKPVTKITKEVDVSKLEKEVGKVIQGDTTDIKPAIESLKIVDTRGLDDYKGLLGKFDDKQKNIIALQDNLLQKEPGQYGLVNTERTISTPLGDKKVNYVKSAIDDIKREIDEVGSFDDYNKALFGKEKTLGEVITKIENNTASLEDLNDLARYYNGTFKDKIYTKQGMPKDTTKAGQYETNRRGIKSFVRDQLSTDELKQLDLQYSNIASTKELIDKINEGVNKLEQKVKERGFLEKGARSVAKAVDILSMGTIRGFFTGLLPSNIGNKINNFIDIQNDLGKHLKEINKLLNKSDLNSDDITRFTVNLQKNADNNNMPSGGLSNTKGNAGIKTPQKLLPAGKIVTPQTVDKAVIMESKKGLPSKEKLKVGSKILEEKTNNYDLAKQMISDTDDVKRLEQMKTDIKELNLGKEEELIAEINSKIKGIKELSNLDNISDTLKGKYGDDLVKSFQDLYKSEINLKTTKGGDKYSTIEFNKSDRFKKFSGKAEEYLSNNPWDNRSVQNIYDELKDQVSKSDDFVIKTPTKVNKNIKKPNKL